MTDSALQLDWEKMGDLIPAIVQHAVDGRVLMVAYMNQAALDKTLFSGRVTFYSRSRKTLWTKGETSGHFLDLKSLHSDCDGDAILVRALPHGPVCHLNTPTCFADEPGPEIAILSSLQQIIDERAAERPEGSYTTSLFESGPKRIAQKVGEEGVETALAGVAGDEAELANESADLLYHMLVLLKSRDMSINDVLDVLKSRFLA